MSDIIYDGGSDGSSTVTIDSGAFGNINDSYDGWSSYEAYLAYQGVQDFKAQEQIDWANFEQPNVKGAGWSTSLSGSTFTYSYKTSSNLYHSAFSVDDVLTQFGGSVDAINPYDERVVYKTTDNQMGSITNYYMDNPAYAEFETIVTEMQNVEYEIVFNSLLDEQTDSSSLTSDTELEYDNDRFGDTDSINSYAQDIDALESEQYEYILKDELTEYYNRIDDTDNSQLISEQEAELQDLRNQLSELINKYDNKEFQDELRRLRKDEDSKSSNWNTDAFWATEKAFDAGLGGGYAPVTQSESLNFIQSGEVNDWMAGGNLYDSPRAGGQLFNVTGDMNTVRFLGLQDKNYNAHLQRELNGMAQLHKMLGVNAGSKSFSIL